MNFQNNKLICLNKLDRSKKGAIDKGILDLVNLINKNPHYYTTSSCSGRIVLISKKSEKKQDTKWLFVTHNKTSFKEASSKLKNLPKEPIWFRFEPMILHIAADSISNAQKIVNTARDLGFKRTGIQSTRKIVIEIASTEIMSTIIAKNGKVLVDDSYLRVLIQEANKKLKRTQNKIKEFLEKIKKFNS